MEHFINEYGIFTTGMAFIGNGIILLSRKERRRNVIFVQLFWFYTLFFAWRSNLDPENELYHGVIQRFFLQNSIILVLIASVAYKMLIFYVANLFPYIKSRVQNNSLIVDHYLFKYAFKAYLHLCIYF